MGKSKRGEYLYRCKCCLDEVGLKNMWTEYYRDGEREIYGEMLTDCFALSWEQPPGDTEMEHICETCVSRLRDAINFKKEILYTEHLILEQLKNVTTEHIKQEEESEDEIETEYLSIEFLEDDNERDESDIKIERPQVKQEKDVLMINRRSKKYTDDDLEKCLEAVRTKALSQNKASILYSVPRKAISSAIARHRNEISKQDDTKRTKIEAEIRCENKKKTAIAALRDELRKHGDNIATILVHTNATPLRCQNDFGYTCSFCSEAYTKPADLKEHTLRTHDEQEKRNYIKGKHVRSYLAKLDITGLKCVICNSKIESLDEMMLHLKEHGKAIHLDINNHIVPFKFDGQELKCTACKIVFNKFKMLLEHMNRHSKNYVCDICGSGYVNSSTFNLHYQSHNKGSFACKHCSKVFETQIKKRSHELAVHVHLQKKSKCGYCGEKFSTRRRKEKHISSVHGVHIQGVKCQVCGKICPTQSALTIHTKRDHLQERRFACDSCNMSFFGSQELKHHMLKHTGVREFQCDVCKKSFGKKWTLREHMRLHADDRRYKCDYCALSFIQRCSLVGHLKSKHNDIYTLYQSKTE
ncbi:zinc finger protein 26-like isoform X1 [Vanessa tameamea]|uniref:Zinc finger protein 26-like isoform X1 n=1 Tax=Vanessa tameamea TaxID=334116 RepID=A0ABM4AWI8_VANTA